MNRSIWIPVLVTVAVLGAAGLVAPTRLPGGNTQQAAAGIRATAASAWSAAERSGRDQFERLSARVWFATHTRAAAVLPELPSLPLETVAWASMILATFAFVRALQFGRRGPSPRQRVLRLARQGVASTLIARRTHLSQDAVRSLMQPAGTGSGRESRNRLPIGRIRRPSRASGSARGREFNAMA